MAQYFILSINLRTLECNPELSLGLFNNPNDAISELYDAYQVKGTLSQGVYQVTGEEDTCYVVLPVTDYLANFVFCEREYTVYYFDKYGIFSIAYVKSIIDLREFDLEDPLIHRLAETLEANSIVAIHTAEQTDHKEITFNVTR